jgi:hypothetical protein
MDFGEEFSEEVQFIDGSGLTKEYFSRQGVLGRTKINLASHLTTISRIYMYENAMVFILTSVTTNNCLGIPC